MASVSVVVFAYQGASQLTAIVPDDVLHPREMHRAAGVAATLVEATQATDMVCGMSTREGDLEVCLVGIPVVAEERVSGRAGLAVVVGVVKHAGAVAAPEMYVEVFREALAPRLCELLPASSPRNLFAWAESLTVEQQRDPSGRISTATIEVCTRLTGFYTRIAAGYRNVGTAPWNRSAREAAPEDGVVHLARLLTEARHRTKVDQMGFLTPVAEVDRLPPFDGRLSVHELSGEYAYVCFERTEPGRPFFGSRS